MVTDFKCNFRNNQSNLLWYFHSTLKFVAKFDLETFSFYVSTYVCGFIRMLSMEDEDVPMWISNKCRQINILSQVE